MYGCSGFAEQFRYLTNFEPLFEGWVVLDGECGARGVVHMLQHWDAERAAPYGWVGGRDLLPFVIAALVETGAKSVGLIGTDKLPARHLTAIREELPGHAFVDVDGAVAALRRFKSALELDAIRAAAAIADAALDTVAAALEPGASEREVSARIEYEVRTRGGLCSLLPFVMAGNDHPTGHRDPDERPIATGETVMVDFVAVVDGYHADLARSFVLGSPSERQLHAWEAVSAAYRAILQALAPGRPCSDLQRAAVSALAEFGYEHPSRVGHGLGLGHSYEWPLSTATTSSRRGPSSASSLVSTSRGRGS